MVLLTRWWMPSVHPGVIAGNADIHCTQHLQHSRTQNSANCIIVISHHSTALAWPYLLGQFPGLAVWLPLLCCIVNIQQWVVSGAMQSKPCILPLRVTVSSFPCSPKQIHSWEKRPGDGSCESLSEDSPIPAQCFQTWSLSEIQQPGEMLRKNWTYSEAFVLSLRVRQGWWVL